MTKALLTFVIAFILSRESPILRIGFRERTAGETNIYPKNQLKFQYCFDLNTVLSITNMQNQKELHTSLLSPQNQTGLLSTQKSFDHALTNHSFKPNPRTSKIYRVKNY